MTKLLTGMNDNGHSNHPPKGSGRRDCGCLCVRSEGRGTGAERLSTSHPKPPTVVPSRKTRVFIHTHGWIDRVGTEPL